MSTNIVMQPACLLTLAARVGSFWKSFGADLPSNPFSTRPEPAVVEAAGGERLPLSVTLRNNNTEMPLWVNVAILETPAPITSCSEFFQIFTAPLVIEGGQCAASLHLAELQVPAGCPAGVYPGKIKIVGGPPGDGFSPGSRQIIAEAPFLIRVAG